MASPNPDLLPGDDGSIPLVRGVFGSGRSGSTWLGSILNTHPRVAYRFEPLHRLGKGRAGAAALRDRLQSEEASDADLERLYEMLLPADPLVEKPPFFKKDNVPNAARERLWPVVKVVKLGDRHPLSPVYRWLYTPRGRPPMVVKEVTHERTMRNLLERTGMRCVYLVRHPCAVVSSTLRGQAKGLMSTGRQGIVDDLLRAFSPELAERFVPRVEAMGPMEREAVLWRMDVEMGFRAAEASPRGRVVLYERFCDDPVGESRGMFEHLGLAFTQATLDFLEQGGEGEEGGGTRGEAAIDEYFSVHRDPAKSKQKWRKRVSAEEERAVMQIVEDSEEVQELARRGGWW